MTGTVQGVGFRPFVYRHAVALGLAGFVLNDAAGRADRRGGTARPDRRARAGGWSTTRHRWRGWRRCVAEGASPSGAAPGFRIVESDDAGARRRAREHRQATCADCLAEVDDPGDRRHGYAFTNCTNCGPRYTIVLDVPYDRPATTMAGFAMCPACQAEYDDPADRRFHAQPNACPACGPQLAWTGRPGESSARRAAR